jgi:hypothetical protein
MPLVNHNINPFQFKGESNKWKIVSGFVTRLYHDIGDIEVWYKKVILRKTDSSLAKWKKGKQTYNTSQNTTQKMKDSAKNHVVTTK